MKNALFFFMAGSLFTGTLFQFDIGLPSFHSYQLQKQSAKIDKARKTVGRHRSQLSNKAVKKAGKKAAGSLIPFVGSVISLGLAAEDYCDELEQILEISNILNTEDEKFSLNECIGAVENEIKSQFN